MEIRQDTAVEAPTLCLEPKTPKQQQRLARILDSARRAFAERPFAAVLMDEVAQGAGVGKGTLYRYFPDKESLYFAVIFAGVEQLKQQIRAPLAAEDALEDKIRSLIETLVGFFCANQLFFRLMNQEDNKVDGEEGQHRRRWLSERSGLVDAIVELLEYGRQSGSLAVVHPRLEAQILLGMVRSVLRAEQRDLTVAQMSNEIARIYLCGMRLGRNNGFE